MDRALDLMTLDFVRLACCFGSTVVVAVASQRQNLTTRSSDDRLFYMLSLKFTSNTLC